jgi:ATP-dependent helicase HrpA
MFFYPPSLPITSHVPELRELIAQNQVVVIAGETGSGKTTQLPKVCLGLFFKSGGLIGCTQPRRIAATSVADRVAEELGADGALVGSKIRFSDRTTPDTRIKFMTDGVLLAETRNDPLLKKYDVIIVDEAHERNLNIDFLLGYLHDLINKRPELKLLITSATIDTDAFSRHFGNCPVLNIEGRNYPVEIIYYPVDEEQEELSYLEHLVEVTAEICSTRPPGDILVFLPTEKDIRTCCEILSGRVPTHLILPLFGRLQAQDQKKIFRQQNRAKIVVATNVAETSVTVPGIRYVVDSGLARIGTYHTRSRTMRLPITRVSQASCNQRAGRSGRIGPGTCYRLYSEDDYNDRPPFTIPEIQRSNLAEVILQMVALKLGSPYDFNFLDPPQKSAIIDGFKTLQELGAITSKNSLTDYGHTMSRLPIDPVIARIIIEAGKNECLSEIVIIAAALAIQDPRIRPADKEQAADQAHSRFAAPNSDFLALLNIWNGYHETAERFSWSSLKKYCLAYYLSFQRMREWLDLHEQLSRLLKKHKSFTFSRQAASYEAIHRSLLVGLFRHSARKKQGSLYQGLGNRELRIFPGSYQHRTKAAWIFAGSFIETSQLFALSVAAIEPDWLEQCARPFCTYSWANVRYHKKNGQVVADETVSLQGLIIISGRRVNFPKQHQKNISIAREVFIQQALVEQQLSGRFDFFQDNLKLLATWQASEDKLRRKGIVIDDAGLFTFYDDRLPPQVCDRTSLVKYLKQCGDKALRMNQEDIVLRRPADKELIDFPPFLPETSERVSLHYSFAPGAPQDGVTAVIPEHMVETINPDLFDWLVPGLLAEKTTLLFKGLPKRLRKKIIPLNDSVARVLDSIELYRGNYFLQLSSALLKLFKVQVHPGDWPRELPLHLRMHFQIIDASHKILMAGDEFSQLLSSLRSAPVQGQQPALKQKDQILIEQLQKKVFTKWDFDDYPKRLPVYLENGRLGGYLYGALEPAPDQQAVKLSYYRTKAEAETIGYTGLRYLIRLHFKATFKELAKHCRISLSGPSALWLHALLGNKTKACESILDYLLSSLVEVGYRGSGPNAALIDREQFETLLEKISGENLYCQGTAIIDRILELLRLRNEVFELIRKYEALTRRSPGGDRELFEDLHNHLAWCLPADFLKRFSPDELDDRKRYLKSLAIRCERAYHNPGKDLDKRSRLAVHMSNIRQRAAKAEAMNEQCRALFLSYCRLVDELRVSLFSPEIKTAIAVSEKKAAQAWKTFIQSC